MWDKLEHDGYEIWVLPMPAYGPASPQTLWHYTAYYCRHGADAHLAGQSTRFSELADTYASEEEARNAGYAEGRRLVDAISAKSAA